MARTLSGFALKSKKDLGSIQRRGTRRVDGRRDMVGWVFVEVLLGV
jgi:hypothetical protein